MTTAARPTSEQSCHWYFPDGRSCYEVPRASGDGMRPTTLADARKLRLLPSVTTIESVLNREPLVQWRIEQAVLACLTSQRNAGEPLDDFTYRILHTEKVQEQESDKAKGLGIQIHDACEAVIKGEYPEDGEMRPWIMPALADLLVERKLVPVVTEHILVNKNRYAGKCDLIAVDLEGYEWVIDFKSTKAAKLPKESFWEHKMQTAAYANCRLGPVRHANVYISTLRCGEFSFCDNGDTIVPFEAFSHLLRYWCLANNYYP